MSLQQNLPQTVAGLWTGGSRNTDITHNCSMQAAVLARRKLFDFIFMFLQTKAKKACQVPSKHGVAVTETHTCLFLKIVAFYGKGGISFTINQPTFQGDRQLSWVTKTRPEALVEAPPNIHAHCGVLAHRTYVHAHAYCQKPTDYSEDNKHPYRTQQKLPTVCEVHVADGWLA